MTSDGYDGLEAVAHEHGQSDDAPADAVAGCCRCANLERRAERLRVALVDILGVGDEGTLASMREVIASGSVPGGDDGEVEVALRAIDTLIDLHKGRI